MPTYMLRLLLAAVLVVLGVGLVACGGEPTLLTPESTESTAPVGGGGSVESTPADTTPQAGTTASTQGPGGGAPTVTGPPATSLDAQAAVDVALSVVPGGAVIEIERDRHDGRPTWEVVVRGADGRGVELDIDAATGEVLRQGPEELPPYARASAPAVDVVTAMVSALAVMPGVVEEAELEQWKDGRVVWEVEIVGTDGRHAEIYIDAETPARVRP